MIVHDTICALATPPGVGGLAVIRLSGADAFTIADHCFRGKSILNETPSHTIHYGKFFSPDGVCIDTVTASVFRAPHSYTGEHTVEFGCHGGMIVSQEIIGSLLLSGARPAQPGEFTKRAFLNNKIDLTQAEAVADLIHSVSQQGSHAAARQLLGGLTRRLQDLRTSLLDICGLLELELDFSTEDIEFVDRTELRTKLRDAIAFCKNLADSFHSSEILRSGYKIGIVGYPNAGKSSLLNAFLQKKRAIVSATPGTTRDYIEEQIVIDGVTFTIFDTAGFRSSEDQIEIEGIQLAQSLLEQCNLILVINDVSLGTQHSTALLARLQEQFSASSFALIHNKTDKEHVEGESIIQNSTPTPIFGISALTGAGLEMLKKHLVTQASFDMDHAGSILINTRHVQLLQLASVSLEAALGAVETAPSNEFIAIDVREALRKIGEITGDSWSEDVLDHVFSRFCIGK